MELYINIPKRGQKLTNGEVLKAIFPSISLYEKNHDAIQIDFNSGWWNSEYKEQTDGNNK